jgi:hypothetical protein
MALDLSGLSGDALKRAQAYNKAMERAEKAMKSQEKIVGQISSTFLGIGGSEFFRNLTTEEYNKKMAQLREQAKGLQNDAQDAADVLDNSFKNILKNSDMSNMSASEIADKLNLSGVAAKKMEEAFSKTAEDGVSITSIIKEMGEYGDDLVDAIVNKADLPENLVKPFEEAFDKAVDLDTQLGIVNDEMENANEQVFDLAQGMRAVGENLTKSFQLNKLVDGLLEFDGIIKQAQIDTGINFTQNASQMAVLTSETARFGMSVQDTTQLMGALGQELRTSIWRRFKRLLVFLQKMLVSLEKNL